MTWWTQEAKKIGSFASLAVNLEEKIAQLDTLAKAKDLGELPNVNNIIRAISSIQNSVAELKRKIESSEKAICSQRISVSLERFENWYKKFSRSQMLRWLVLEWGFPIFLSLWALYLVFPWKIELYNFVMHW